MEGQAPQASSIKIAPNKQRRMKTAVDDGEFVANSYAKRGSLRTSFNRKIRSVLSPGTYYSSASSLAVRLPTGERARSVSLAYVWSATFQPDKNGEIIIAGLPFAEVPFAQIIRPNSDAQNNEIESITAIQPAVFKEDANFFKSQKIYGWRMNAQSVTVECVGNLTTNSGEVFSGSIPPSIDNKTLISDTGGITGYARTLDHLPVTPDSLASVTRAYRKDKARDGVYAVNRHTDASLPFTYRDRDENKAYSGLWQPTKVDYKPVNLYAATNDSAGIPVSNATSDYVPVTAASCTDITMVIFRGLQADCSYSAKFIACIEVMVKMGSPLVPLAQPIEPRSYTFLEALNRAEASRALGNADSNDWGSFFDGLNKAWDFLTPVADTVASVIPGPAGAVAKQITGLNKKINEAVKQMKKQNSAGQQVQLVQPVQPALGSAATQPVQLVAQPVSYNPPSRVRGRALQQ